MDYNKRFFLVYDKLKKEGLIKSYVELATVLQTNKYGINDLKSGKKKLSIDDIENMKLSYSNISIEFIIMGKGNEFINDKAKEFSTSTKLLIDEIKELVSINERLKIENDKLKKENETKKNPYKYSSIAAEPEP